jgi:membrane protease YdiL (CAAX protease family)
LRNALIILLAAGAAGLLYIYSLSIPAALGVPLLAAALVEAALYLATVTESARKRVERYARPLPLWMAASGVAPYLLCTVPLGRFSWAHFAVVAGLAALVSFWYVVAPVWRPTDVLFVCVVAAGLLLKPFNGVYPEPRPQLEMSILGRLMWARLAMMAVLSVAKMPVKGFGPWPTRNEWIAGARNFALFLPLGVAVGWISGFASFRPHPADWRFPLVAVGTFAGMLLVVALTEEFFVRGLLQEWATRWFRSETLALIAVAVIFGLVHLPFRGFPNWTFASLAALAGLFYGRAYIEGRGVRAAMVTHALVNTVWRVLF